MSIKNKWKEKNSHKIWDIELGHVFEDAEKWWEKKGKDLIRNRSFSGSHAEQQKALNATDPLHPNFVPSGVLRGLPWPLLTPKERHNVCKYYLITLYNTIKDNA